MKSRETRFYSIDAKDRKDEAKAIEELVKLATEHWDAIVLTSDALLNKYMPRNNILNNIIEIYVDSVLDINGLSSRLIEIGYTKEHKVEGVGQFSQRGGIFDIFSPGNDNPIRIELFGDEIDSMRNFDIYTQKSIEKQNKVTILPAKTFIYPKDIDSAVKMIEKEIINITNDDIKYDLEKIKMKTYFSGIEKYIDYFYDSKYTNIFSYNLSDNIFIINDPNRAFEKARNYFNEFSENFKNSLEKGFALKKQGKLLFSVDYAREVMEDEIIVLNSYLPKHIVGFNVPAVINFDTREVKKFQGKIELFFDELLYLIKNNYRVIISDGKLEILKRLEKALIDEGFSPIFYDNKDIFKRNNLILLNQKLSTGYIYTDEKIAVFSGEDIFRHTRENALKKINKHKEYKSKKIESFIELKKGDYVVHETYGIGHFVALEQKDFDGLKKDYIKVIYGGGDTLYLPLEQMNRIQKYIGNSNNNGIKLSKLGSSEWKKSKSKAKKVVEEIAKDIVKLYAKRQITKGYQFREDTIWQSEFEDEFPHEETQDQLRAIIDMKSDMESAKVTDRLICGDVGYGKTEVAIRGIFKACMDSKQCAVLCPTTILAQQHYKNIKARFGNYPIRVEVLSRFKTKKEHEEIKKRLKQGLIDVIVGTHSILSDSVEFKDLGLLVIDEEHRFGVKHKEKLKEFKSSIDVVTLTATPIPRTLHLSLSGIRDMSVLEEPPHNRYPILTYVTEAKEGIIVDSIERELSRKGQVFFVYNRVETMEKMYLMLKRLLPNAEIAMAHGQMSSRKLENIMIDFYEKKYDVLLATTIIETGLDISNANTMIIYDADKMGLSQLYQLRGRVGRSNKQAYAYFMYEKDKVLTEIAERRLKAIREFTEFGSGFKIAMRDLEIRGAGSILGESQSGHMAEIGYELYIKFLDEAIKNLQGEIVSDIVEPEVIIKLDAYIPNDYIENEIDKIEVYKKIVSINSKEELLEIDEEIEDRFSDIPDPVRVLLQVAYLKSICKKLKISVIKEVGNMYSFYDYNKNLVVKKIFSNRDSYKLITSIVDFLEKML
ncbi:MAG: transcription-repair coupling factor [Filifactoraceae bacterium]